MVGICWPQECSEVDIAVKELVPHVIVGAPWESRRRECHVLFHVDNMAVVTSVQHLNACNPLLWQLFHCLHFYLAHYSFTFITSHILGFQNVAADVTSQGNVFLFSSLSSGSRGNILQYPWWTQSCSKSRTGTVPGGHSSSEVAGAWNHSLHSSHILVSH